MSLFARPTDEYEEVDPLLGVAAPSSNRSVLKRPRLPCIIKDVEEEYVEAEQSKMFLYPQKKYYQTLANRIIYSQAYIIIYCIMLVLSSLLLGLAIANWEHLAQGYVTVRQNPGFYMLDAVVTLFVLFEVTVRLMGQGVRFWRSVSNFVDFGLATIATVSMLVFWVAGSLPPRMAQRAVDQRPVIESFEFVNAVFVILRFIYVLSRLLIYSCDRCCKRKVGPKPVVARIVDDGAPKP